MSIFKRVFSRKNPINVTKSIRVTEAMATALEKLAKEAGETLNSYIVLVLDQYLQIQLDEGKVDHPIINKEEEKQSAS